VGLVCRARSKAKSECKCRGADSADAPIHQFAFREGRKGVRGNRKRFSRGLAHDRPGFSGRGKGDNFGHRNHSAAQSHFLPCFHLMENSGQMGLCFVNCKLHDIIINLVWTKSIPSYLSGQASLLLSKFGKAPRLLQGLQGRIEPYILRDMALTEYQSTQNTFKKT